MDSDQTKASPSSTAPDNRWQPSAEEFARLHDGPVVSHLDDLAVLQIEGADAVPFLHAQVTADIAAMTGTSWQLGGYCTPKGRLLAIFEAWRWQDGLRLTLPATIAEATLRRLSMFVLRSKARLSNVTQAWSVLAIFGAGSAELLDAAGLRVPQQVGECTMLANDGRLARRPHGANCTDRFILVMPAHERTSLLEGLQARMKPKAAQSPGLVSSALWWWSQVDAAVPSIFASTRETFVPQAVNLEVLDGVSFRKGCYPGQEIVARSQYLGKLRRRLMLGHASQVDTENDIFQDQAPSPVGRIVMAAAAPHGGWDLLFECPTDKAEQGNLRVGRADGPELELRTLPYPIFDPTA